MCWSSRSVNTSQTCLMCSLVQLCCLHADLCHLALSLTEMGVDIGISYFSLAVRKYLTAAAYKRFLVLVSQFKLQYSQFTMEESHGSLRQCSHFFQPGSREANVCAQLLSTFYYSVWYSSSWNSSAQTGQVFLIFLHQVVQPGHKGILDILLIGHSRFHQVDKINCHKAIQLQLACLSPFRAMYCCLSVVHTSSLDAFVFIIVISSLFLNWSFHHSQLPHPTQLKG